MSDDAYLRDPRALAFVEEVRQAIEDEGLPVCDWTVGAYIAGLAAGRKGTHFPAARVVPLRVVTTTD